MMMDDYCNDISVGAITGTQQLKCNFTLPAITPLLMAWKGVDGDQGVYLARFDVRFPYAAERQRSRY